MDPPDQVLVHKDVDDGEESEARELSLIQPNQEEYAPVIFAHETVAHVVSIDMLSGKCLPQKISQAIPILVAGENYILQDTNGQRWEVKSGTKDGVLAFREGWTRFYEDHGLRVGYILTFHYFRNSYFVVEIFDTTGFEKLKFPVATGKKRKRSEIEGKCNTVGECPNLSDHSTKKQGWAPHAYFIMLEESTILFKS